MDDAELLLRQRGLYWAKITDLEIALDYMRLYRRELGRWVTGVATVRAIASSVSIGAWAIWHQYAFVWAFIIMCSQVADALRDVFPFTKRYQAASEYIGALERLFIDAQLEWDNIVAEKYSADQISKKLHSLRMLHHTLDVRHSKDGFPEQRKDLLLKAQSAAGTFLGRTYGVQSLSGGITDGED